ncbi:hypothetical protein EPR50_G00234210 [Perca flavescens]|uniref:Uncharacterized protein n=1 Tax=Perca flavescens TaxID=8167 RepID=A0A484C5F8_PERFV|nr:hypothetical protein EPR50_G00234210 [Perca flavescens]
MLRLWSLRRGSSFSFLTPGPQWDFSLKRKRREKDDSDAVSLCSFDFKVRPTVCGQSTSPDNQLLNRF